jgi:hypothetical protein
MRRNRSKNTQSAAKFAVETTEIKEITDFLSKIAA